MTPLLTLTEPKSGDERTATLRRLTWLLDDLIRLPLGFRIGLDALIGLVPGLGDALGGAAALYGIGVAWRLGAPVVVLTRMLLNTALDVLVGALPLLGDLFDAGFASHRRNLAILEHWLARPEHAARRSKLVLFLFVLTLLLIMAAAAVLSIWLFVWVIRVLLMK